MPEFNLSRVVVSDAPFSNQHGRFAALGLPAADSTPRARLTCFHSIKRGVLLQRILLVITKKQLQRMLQPASWQACSWAINWLTSVFFGNIYGIFPRYANLGLRPQYIPYRQKNPGIKY